MNATTFAITMKFIELLLAYGPNHLIAVINRFDSNESPPIPQIEALSKKVIALTQEDFR